MTQRSTWPRAMAFAALGAAEVLRVDRATRRPLAACPMPPTQWSDPAVRRVAVARATPHLRKRHHPRSDDRCGFSARSSGSSAARVGPAWSGWSPAKLGRPPLGDSRRRQRPRRLTARDSTSSPLRWPPSPMPVPARWPSTATDDGRTESAWPRPGSSATTTSARHVGSRHRGGLRRPGRDGANRNQGTESTLAFLSTLQHARRVRHASCDESDAYQARSSQPGPHCGRPVAGGDPTLRPGTRGLRPSGVAILRGAPAPSGTLGRRGGAELRGRASPASAGAIMA